MAVSNRSPPDALLTFGQKKAPRLAAGYRPTQWRAIASAPDVIGMGCKIMNIQLTMVVPAKLAKINKK